ncbi:hypothetical protein R1T08_14885 [Streptomyces sp. SBC-4]|nr:hypothetical protein [Streptomyces sp. SBC-4]MDV5145462.1 hypothetical protein [Streptomyces sp. SBC-4]
MRLRLRDDAPGLMAFGQGRRAGRWSLRFRTVASLTLGFAFLFVPSAAANPFCYIPMVCEVKDAIDFVQDPLGFLLQKLTEANLWFLRQMLELLQNSSKIDLSSPGFLKQYAIIFAASSLLTVALWLIAVAKRAVRGVAITTAVGEAVGLLLLQFVVNALTPASIALLMKAIDEVTAVFEPYAVDNFKPFLEDVLTVMASTPSEGVGQLLVVNLVMLCGALLMWVELLIRSAAIYVAVALAPIVKRWSRGQGFVGQVQEVVRCRLRAGTLEAGALRPARPRRRCPERHDGLQVRRRLQDARRSLDPPARRLRVGDALQVAAELRRRDGTAEP